MTICRNKYFLATNYSPGLPGLFGFVKSLFKKPQVFRSAVDLTLVGLSELTTGALLACKRAYNR
jgi:hypothetical protein